MCPAFTMATQHVRRLTTARTQTSRMRGGSALPWLVLLLTVVASVPVSSTPALPHNFTQLVDHFGADGETFQQRYYENLTWWDGAGSPIICIMGGEGAIEPSTGIFYPWITDVVARELKAMVVEPEHRFYGTSLPLGASSFDLGVMRRLFTPQQALADAAFFVESIRKRYGCMSGPRRCPVITVGGSYPGWLSGMMRLRYPGVVDMAYAASAPMRFYSQQVDQFAYYQKVTESAEAAVAGCADAVRSGLAAVRKLGDKKRAVAALNLCTPLPAYMAGDNPASTQLFFEEVEMVIMYTWADLNMGNYPPPNTPLRAACEQAVKDSGTDVIRDILHNYGLGSIGFPGSTRQDIVTDGPSSGECYNLSTQLPSGANATITSGDWSGVGAGRNGESWDFQTCTFLVEAIGTNGRTDMFTPRNWSLAWLNKHCAERFGVTPEPRALADLWGFDRLNLTGASKIIFTNGMTDGWSVGGITTNLSDTLVAINIADGAHHSDLSHQVPSDADTPAVVAARQQALDLLQAWLEA